MTVLETYCGSDGEATKALYARLEAVGPAGIIALNLFRAQKCSSRAKEYRRRGHKSDAYDRKSWSLFNLCRELTFHADNYKMKWGWKKDPEQAMHCWVLYVELPTGQVSFHAAGRGMGPDYPFPWDGTHISAERIVRWCGIVLNEPVAHFVSDWEKYVGYSTSPRPSPQIALVIRGEGETRGVQTSLL